MNAYPRLSNEAYKNDRIHKEEALEILTDEICSILRYYGIKIKHEDLELIFRKIPENRKLD